MASPDLLARRLELLRESGQVDADIAGFLLPAFGSLADRLELTLDDESFGTAITHTALALQRARAGEAIETWSSDHGEELAAFPAAVTCAESFAADAERHLSLTLPAKEREFVALHFAALLLREKAS